MLGSKPAAETCDEGSDDQDEERSDKWKVI